jgi:hypothetical protein
MRQLKLRKKKKINKDQKESIIFVVGFFVSCIVGYVVGNGGFLNDLW